MHSFLCISNIEQSVSMDASDAIYATRFNYWVTRNDSRYVLIAHMAS